MTSRLEDAIAAVSQLSETTQNEIANLILEKLALDQQNQSSETKATQDRMTGLFADEPELMDQIMESIDHDRETDQDFDCKNSRTTCLTSSFFPSTR